MPRTRRLAVAVAAVPLVVALSGCSVVSAFTPHVTPAIYDTAKEFNAANTKSIGSPSFVPDDATVIRVDYDTHTGEAIMTYTSQAVFKKDVCKLTNVAPPKPTIQDSWWPISGIPNASYSCPGGWSAFTVAPTQLFAVRPATGSAK
ncbi:hypothetical protein [Leifsonia shinshuensis]|uniref:Lipoprotein n=1 Tax=Leifsonia shinshuensis TaxID=150026 RepID=A0A7G6YF91_9MICO|nr:hypothetical protein [Leifsonia shinshuensis]QNE37156.1 hypothetical protein F1C12_19920 [Leifsonia shinshuensis]